MKSKHHDTWYRIGAIARLMLCQVTATNGLVRVYPKAKCDEPMRKFIRGMQMAVRRYAQSSQDRRCMRRPIAARILHKALAKPLVQ